MEVLMSNKEILDEVYHRLCNMLEATSLCQTNQDKIKMSMGAGRALKSFIEEEWQKRDEEEMVSQYNRNRSPKDWIVDVREMERHHGLEIGEDGTVKELK